MSTQAMRPVAATTFRFAQLALAVAQATAAAAHAQTPQQLERVVITADPIERDDLNTLQPINVLRGDALREKEATNLGTTLGRELGVHSSAYGPGAGRPIIRGMDSARVRVTESGLGVADVSGVSPDHRVSADVFNSRQIEVLRGPVTLLYGSGAVGGLVNIVSDRIPQRIPGDFGATVNLRGSTAEHEALGAIGLDGPISAHGAWRLEGFRQKTKNYDLAAPLRSTNGNVIAEDHLPNSQTDTQSVSLGGAWMSGHTRVGVAVQRYESDYGIPNPEEPVIIDLKRSRFELQADHTAAFSSFSGLRSKFSITDYQHIELEPSGAAGSIFTHNGGEGRLEFSVPTLAGFKTVLGTQMQLGDTRGVGEGELPKTGATALALFAVGEQMFGASRVDLGARIENQKYKVRESYESSARAIDRNFWLYTVSGGGAWTPSPGFELGTTLTLSQRAPAIEELYYLGAHPATFSFEIGDPTLKKERSTHLELGLKYDTGAVRSKANLFYNQVRDYIFGAFDGTTTDILDENGNVEEALSNLYYRQADARIRGAEVEVTFGRKTGPQGRAWGDTVRGALTSGPFGGGKLPRFSPSRLGIDFGWKAEAWNVNAAITRVFKQSQISNFDLRDGEPETATGGYTTLDASFSYRWRGGNVPLTLYLIGRNLTNEDIRIHTSFLKNSAPPPGRSVLFGVRATI